MTKAKKSTKPSHRAIINTGSEDKPYWQDVGACWSHKDGKGMTLKLSAVPVNGGDILIRTNEEKPAAKKAA